MRRTHFEAEHDEFRQLARSFFEKECVPFADEWEKAGQVSREVWKAAGVAGLLAPWADEIYGGAGITDFRFSQVLTEEFFGTGTVGFGISIQNDVMQPYLQELTNAQQKARWIPGTVSGDIIWAIAMSEPGAGSDLAAMRSTAVRDGDAYVINGAKTFITNGKIANRIVVAVKTDPKAGSRGVSLIVVEEDMAGFSRGRTLDKIGLKSQDTSELFFDNVRVPVANLLGEEDKGFYALMQNLAQERLGVAIVAYAVMKRALAITIDYVREREVFGSKLGAMQHTRFELAELKTVVDVAESCVDRAVVLHNAGELSAEDAAGLKQWTTDQQCNLVDRCLQFFGGYGYCNEYEIARIYRDSRIQRIYAGSNEVMKEIVGRSMKLDKLR